MGICSKNIVQLGHLIRGQIAINVTHNNLEEFEVREFSYRSVKLVLKLHYYNFGSFQRLHVLISFKKQPEEKRSGDVYAATINSEKLGVTGVSNTNILSPDDGTYRLIYQGLLHSLFDVSIRLFVCTFDVNEYSEAAKSCFATFIDDTDFTDVELVGDNGSVAMHRLVVGGASLVMRRMLSGPWKEAADRRVMLPGTTRETLQHLKDYLYLYILPENGLEQLLLLASCYMITVLETRCIDKLILNLTSDKACELLEFAVSSQMQKLEVKVLECVQKKALDVKQMRGH